MSNATINALGIELAVMAIVISTETTTFPVMSVLPTLSRFGHQIDTDHTRLVDLIVCPKSRRLVNVIVGTQIGAWVGTPLQGRQRKTVSADRLLETQDCFHEMRRMIEAHEIDRVENRSTLLEMRIISGVGHQEIRQWRLQDPLLIRIELP
jgi:hypothetical protein